MLLDENTISRLQDVYHNLLMAIFECPDPHWVKNDARTIAEILLYSLGISGQRLGGIAEDVLQATREYTHEADIREEDVTFFNVLITELKEGKI